MIRTTPSVLRHRAHGNTAPAVASRIRHLAQVAREAGAAHGDHLAPRHAASLNGLADLIDSKPLSDQNLYMLTQLCEFEGDDFNYLPGPQQRRLLGMLGVDREAPKPEDVFDELVAAAVDDYRERKESELGALRAEANKVEPETRRGDEAEAQATTAASEAFRLEADLEEANATIASLREQNAHLADMLGGEGEPAPRTDVAKEKRPRRRAVEGVNGVYECWNAADEMSYELGWREDNKKRWHVVGHSDLDKAIRERAEITGEAVAA